METCAVRLDMARHHLEFVWQYYRIALRLQHKINSHSKLNYKRAITIARGRSSPSLAPIQARSPSNCTSRKLSLSIAPHPSQSAALLRKGAHRSGKMHNVMQSRDRRTHPLVEYTLRVHPRCMFPSSCFRALVEHRVIEELFILKN